MSFTFMQHNNTFGFISDQINMNIFFLFSSWINNLMFLTKINESKSIETKISSI